MPCFAFKTEKSEIVDSYIIKTNERLNSKAKTPFFDGDIIIYKDIYIFIINIYFLPLWFIGPIIWLGGFLLWGFNLVTLITGLIPFSFVLFWTKYPFMLGNYLGLKKAGYKGKIKIV